jgi:hypothetical protein
LATVGTTNGSDLIFFDYIQDVDDLYNYNSANAGRSLPIHPRNIARLDVNALNWGRYAFRELRLIYYPFCSTGVANGYVINLSTDPTWVFANQIVNLGADQTGFLLNSSPKLMGSFWIPTSLDMASHHGQKTWPTTYPLIDSSGDPGTTLLADVAENFIQAVVTGTLAIGVGGATGGQGYLFIEYICDFYVERNLQNLALGPMEFSALPLESSSSSSSSSSVSSSSVSGTQGGAGWHTRPRKHAYQRPLGKIIACGEPLSLGSRKPHTLTPQEKKLSVGSETAWSTPLVVGSKEPPKVETKLPEDIPAPPKLKRSDPRLSFLRSSIAELDDDSLEDYLQTWRPKSWDA